MAVWKAYFNVSTDALADSNFPVSDLRPYLTDDEYVYNAKRVAEFRRQGLKTVGTVSTREFKVLESDPSQGRVVALVCIDNGDSKLIDSEGKDRTPRSRGSVGTVKLTFATERGSLKIDRDAPWTSESAC